jgi:hypothetical protein
MVLVPFLKYWYFLNTVLLYLYWYHLPKTIISLVLPRESIEKKSAYQVFRDKSLKKEPHPLEKFVNVQ